jgi:hypothetical protein
MLGKITVLTVAIRNAVNFYSTTADVCQYMHKYIKFMSVNDD